MKDMKNHWEKEFDALLGRLVDDDLSVRDRERLNAILLEHLEAREIYRQYLDVHGALQEHLAEPDFSALDPVLEQDVAAPTGNFSRGFWAMAALIVIGLFINILVQRTAQKKLAASRTKVATEQAKVKKAEEALEKTAAKVRRESDKLHRAVVKPIATIKALSGSLVYTGDRGIVRKDLKEGDSLKGGTIEGMTPDAWFELKFVDGSTVMISGNSMLTFSDDGQKKLRLMEGGFSANVKPQPKDRPMLVQTRTAMFEVLGTRFSVDAEPTAATLTVSEGRVRATRLSDNLSVDVPAKHRVVASQDHELTPKRLPDSISIWESRLERGAKEGNGDWVPAQEGEPAHLRAIPYTISAKLDKQQRTIYTISTRVSQKDSPSVILKPGSRIRVQGKMDTPHAIWFGVTLRRSNGDFAGHFQIVEPAERFQPGETFDVTLNPEEYHLDPSLKKWAAGLAKTPFDLKVGSVWCHSLWDSVGLQVSKMEILAPEKSGN